MEVNRYAVNRGSKPMHRDKGDSLTVMGLQMLVGLRGLDELCGAGLKLKISRKTGEQVSREICV